MADFRTTVFSSTISELETTGFTEWLVQSFCRKLTGPKVGKFHYEEDDFFGPVFAKSIPKFSDRHKYIVKQAVETAFEQFSTTDSNYENLFNLATIAETAEAEGFIQHVGRIINEWIPVEFHSVGRCETTRIPTNDTEIYCLRETLECVFRCLFLLQSTGNYVNLECDLQTIGRWCISVFIKRPGLRELVPAWAPMFVLAHHTLGASISPKNHEIADELIAIFNSGFLTIDDPFPTFFQYEEKDRKYPFARTAILSKLSEWIHQELNVPVPLQRFRTILSEHALPNATQGNGPQDGEKILEDHMLQLVATQEAAQ